MFDFHIPRAQQCQQLAVSCGLVLAHLGNCRWTAVSEVSQQRRDELAIQLLTMTRADWTAGARNRLPGMYQLREHVVAGELRSTAASFPDLSRGAASYVHKILQGTRPADLPVQQPTKFDLTVNLKTAKALGLTIPESFLLLAAEEIE